MAGIEEKVLTIVPNMTKAIVYSMSEMTDIICKLLEERQNDKIARDILDYSKKGGNIEFVAFDEMVGNDFKKALSEAGVSFVEGSIDGAQKKVLFIKESDNAIVTQLKRDVLLSRGRINELTLKEMLDKSHNKKIDVCKNLDDVMINRIRARARENHVVFAAERNSSGSNNVYFDTADRKMMNYVLFRAAWDINGHVGRENADKIQYDLDQKTNFREALYKQEEKYIVSAKNPDNYIHISEKGISVYENDKLVNHKEKMANDFDIYANYQFEKIKNPVSLTKEDFYSANVEQKIKEQDKLRPVISQATKDLWKKEEAVRALVELKMSLDNGYQLKNISSLYNDDVSFGEFFHLELDNDQYEEEYIEELKEINSEEEKLFKEQILTTMSAQEKFEIETLSVDSKSLDTIIREYTLESEGYKEDVREQKDLSR